MIKRIIRLVPEFRVQQTQAIFKLLTGMFLVVVSSAANAIELVLVKHNQTSGSNAISSLITDGSHVSGLYPASTAIWDWDGTTLTSTGLYSAGSSIGSSIYSSTVLGDRITDLTIDTSTSTATATAYACLEGTFLSTVGASGCGGYQYGTEFHERFDDDVGPRYGNLADDRRR